jgi:hypothetical protein
MSPLLLNAILVVMSWVVAGLISWGYLKAKVAEYDTRMKDAEVEIKLRLPRDEYERRNADLIRQLDRIELKLDRIGKR